MPCAPARDGLAKTLPVCAPEALWNDNVQATANDLGSRETKHRFGLVTSGAGSMFGSVRGSVAVGRECSARYLSKKALRDHRADLERKAS